MTKWRNGESSELISRARRGEQVAAIAEALHRPVDEVRDRIYTYRRRGDLPSTAQMDLLSVLVLAGGERAVDSRLRKTVASCARHGWLEILEDPGWPRDIICRLTDAGWIHGVASE